MTVTNEERVVGGGVNITFRLFQAPPSPFPGPPPLPLLHPAVSISKSNMAGCINDLEFLKS